MKDIETMAKLEQSQESNFKKIEQISEKPTGRTTQIERKDMDIPQKLKQEEKPVREENILVTDPFRLPKFSSFSGEEIRSKN